MRYHPLLGPAAPEHGWVPTPRYLLRRERIFSMLPRSAHGRVLEVGCGSGALLHELSSQGLECSALEPSAAARALAIRLAKEAALNVSIYSDPQPDWDARFDFVLAFDVLEHIEDDAATLRLWHQWLAPDGKLVLSVPAHARSWGAGDVWAGHFRRYERAGLCELLQRCGFALEVFECYGFPVANLSEKLASGMYRRSILRGGGDAASTRRANNDRSGIDRSRQLRLFSTLASVPGSMLLRLALASQRMFLNTDLGSGYVLRARRA